MFVNRSRLALFSVLSTRCPLIGLYPRRELDPIMDKAEGGGWSARQGLDRWLAASSTIASAPATHRDHSRNRVRHLCMPGLWRPLAAPQRRCRRRDNPAHLIAQAQGERGMIGLAPNTGRARCQDIARHETLHSRPELARPHNVGSSRIAHLRGAMNSEACWLSIVATVPSEIDLLLLSDLRQLYRQPESPTTSGRWKS